MINRMFGAPAMGVGPEVGDGVAPGKRLAVLVPGALLPGAVGLVVAVRVATGGAVPEVGSTEAGGLDGGALEHAAVARSAKQTTNDVWRVMNYLPVRSRRRQNDSQPQRTHNGGKERQNLHLGRMKDSAY